MSAPTENFRDKYTRAGSIGNLLVDSFFRSAAELVTPVLDDIGNVLEVGVGEGYSTERLRPLFHGRNYQGSELEPERVRLAQARNPGLEIRQESVYALDRADRAFDLVICLEVLEHLEDPERALEELCRVSGRFVLLSVPREPLWRFLNVCRGKYLRRLGNTPGHIQHWSSHGLRRLVGARFEVRAYRHPIPWTMLLLSPRRRPSPSPMGKPESHSKEPDLNDQEPQPG